MEGDLWEPKGSHGRGPLGAQGILWEEVFKLFRVFMILCYIRIYFGGIQGSPRISLEADGVSKDNFGYPTHAPIAPPLQTGVSKIQIGTSMDIHTGASLDATSHPISPHPTHKLCVKIIFLELPHNEGY